MKSMEFSPTGSTQTEKDDKMQKMESFEDKEKKYKEQFIKNFFEQGLIEKEKEGLVCDVDKIKNLSQEKAREYGVQSIYYKGKTRTFNWQACLLDYFQNKKIYSKNDFEKLESGQEVEPKNLFYTPESEKDAFDIEKIKESDFYLSLSDLTGTWNKINEFTQTKLDYNAEAAELALRIYHPDFGNGYRDKNNKLMVKSKNKDGYVKLGSDWLRSCGIKKRFTKGKEKRNPLFASPKKIILEDNYDTLRTRGLLTENDFEHTETSSAADIFRRESGIGKKGTVFIEGAKYTLGSQFEGQSIVKLSDSVYGIIEDVKGYKKVTHTFSPVDNGLIEKKKEDFRKRRGREAKPADIVIGKSDIIITPYSETGINKRKADETAEQYAERIPTAVKNYNMLQQFSKDLSGEAQIGIHKLSLKEQSWLAEYAYSMEDKYDEVVGFAKKYGLDGLKAFISSEYGTEYGDRLLEIDNLMENKPELYTSILKRFNNINNLAEKTSEMFSEIKSEKNNFSDQLSEAFSRRAKDILNTLYLFEKDGFAQAEFWGKKLKVETEDEIVSALETLETKLNNLSKIFKGEGRLIYKKEHEATFVDNKTNINQRGNIFETSAFLLESDKNPKQVMIQTRLYPAPYGLHNKDLEFDGEARINFIFVDNPHNPEQPIEDVSQNERSRATSIRIDREGERFDENGDLLAVCDPTAPKGNIAVDMGSFAWEDNKETDGDILGKVITIGNDYAVKHDAYEHGKKPQAYHNRASFSKEFGEIDKYANIVIMVRDKLDKIYKKNKSEKVAA